MKCIFIFLLLLSNYLSAESLTVGKTYSISEPNPYDEISERSSKIDWEKIKKGVTKRKTFINKMRAKTLPRTISNETRLITPVASAPADILRQDGSILYPKGYKFNPLAYRKLSGRIVVLDEEDITGVEFLPSDTIIINKGSIENTSKKLKAPTFILDKFTASTLDLRSSPTVITQVGEQLEYKEITVGVNYGS